MNRGKIPEMAMVLALIAFPYIVWFAIFAVNRCWNVNPRPALPWFRVVRYLTWGSAIVLLFLNLALDHFPMAYGPAMIALSAGLSQPEGWVRRRFAPDLIEPSSPDGFWPSKPE